MIHLPNDRTEALSLIAKQRAGRQGFATAYVRAAVLLLILLSCGSQQLSAQKKPTSGPEKLPPPEKIIDGYLKAIGGKKRVAAVRNATYDWAVQTNDQTTGTARRQTKAPASVRTEIVIGGHQTVSAANTSSAWIEELGGARTLTGAEAATAKLQAVLEASHLVDYKKTNILARVVSVGNLVSEPAYMVEFSTRNGAHLAYWFGVRTKLLLKITNDVGKTTINFDEYRPEGNILEPHRVSITGSGKADFTLLLQHANYKTAIADSVFDPPRADASLNVAALMREVGRNQDEVEKRVTEYAFLQKQTAREINDHGEIKKETVKVHEVFPVANREPIMKLISENGVPLSGERAAKEEKRVTEEFLKAEHDRDKDQQKADRRREERLKKRAAKQQEDEDPDISQFLKVCEFVSPRRERFRDRDAVVFDFRPRQGFKPGNRQESLISKLVGVVWIDPADKQVMRLEARMAEGFKMGGGLLVSVRPGAGIVMEQTRMKEGVWLPSFAQINLSVKVLLFAGGDINQTIEWSDYKHFSGDVRDYKLDTPKVDTPADKKP